MSTALASPVEIIATDLTPYLGPNMARVAARMCAERATGRSDGTLTPGEVERALGMLRPMLRTLLGRARTDVVLLQLTQHLVRP
ncbi:MAG TPA: hypothetical protein VFG59_13070 [Anaeromyxobacter sp.]|nr:hypothetical protein [Anaeromyxobacter sp.]